MDDRILRKVQLQLLEIACEVRRVCDKYGIPYWLDAGTCLGAVRHSGFIPWDDDMDFGMLRRDYEKFKQIAGRELQKEYFFQEWSKDEQYPLPYGKVRKRGTKYVERASKKSSEDGFFIDIFPYDYFPQKKIRQKILVWRLTNIERTLLMQCGYRPWKNDGRNQFMKKLAYIPYRFLSKLTDHRNLTDRYEKLAKRAGPAQWLYAQAGISSVFVCRTDTVKRLKKMKFEGETFSVPGDCDHYLTSMYGNYMELPPADERVNRHQIMEVDFGGEKKWQIR